MAVHALILSLLALVTAIGAPPSSEQKPAGNPARINACSILTRDMVAKVTTNKTILGATPQESPVGLNGSHCNFGVVMQIDAPG
jgi:hypothetical protein